jgi:hypothetical protein
MEAWSVQEFGLGGVIVLTNGVYIDRKTLA